jgi:hypothetical protein
MGPLSISLQNQTFADALSTSLAAPATSAAGITTLILLGVPMLLGFSERALTSFEQRVFGNTKAVAKTDWNHSSFSDRRRTRFRETSHRLCLGDIAFDGAEAVVGPVIIATMLLPYLVAPPLVRQIRAEGERARGF